uniref:K Homology domain-containing protein n=1 Tax=Phlebotomus papatasi TaxID=29031 RepID=A0A1B0GQ72_PHLPP
MLVSAQEKPLRISGDPQKVEHAKQLVYELIQDKEAFQNRGFNHGAGGGGGGPGGGGGGGMMNPGNEQMEVFVPKVAVGVVIGKGGDMIKKIQGETGCKLQFIQGRGDSPGDRRCYIQGSKQQVDDAKRMIDDLIENVMRRENGERGMNRNGGGGGGGGGNFSDYGKPMREEVSFVVPASKCGIIIGRGGDTIKQINQQSGAHCEMDRKAQTNNNEKTFIIRGNPDQIEHARSIISEKIGLDIQLIGGSSGGVGGPSYPGMQGSAANTGYPQQWGYTPQSWDQQQQQQQAQVQINPSTGQPDYSQQWIEYYRSMGLHREADIIEQQQKAKQQAVQAQQTLVAGSGAPNGAPVQAQTGIATVQTQQMQQAAGGQPDYSAQWAEYYRSIGKIEEAEAIENQIKASK